MKSLTHAGVSLAAASLLAFSVTGFAADEAKTSYKPQKVVYHINDLDTADGALRNVKNHLNALGDKNIEIRVVTHSSGSMSLVEGSKDKKNNSFSDTVASLSNRGVKFYICGNTIRGLKIDKAKINLVAKEVPSGVAEVAALQQEGFQYLKP